MVNVIFLWNLFKLSLNSTLLSHFKYIVVVRKAKLANFHCPGACRPNCSSVMFLLSKWRTSLPVCLSDYLPVALYGLSLRPWIWRSLRSCSRRRLRVQRWTWLCPNRNFLRKPHPRFLCWRPTEPRTWPSPWGRLVKDQRSSVGPSKRRFNQ